MARQEEVRYCPYEGLEGAPSHRVCSEGRAPHKAGRVRGDAALGADADHDPAPPPPLALPLHGGAGGQAVTLVYCLLLQHTQSWLG